MDDIKVFCIFIHKDLKTLRMKPLKDVKSRNGMMLHMYLHKRLTAESVKKHFLFEQRQLLLFAK
jgi:hypothetical protein